MSWFKIVIYGLAGLVGLQLVVVGGIWMSNLTTPEKIGVFDAERAVLTFVEWSEDRLEEDEFKGLLVEFERQVDEAIIRYGQGNELLILRSDAVLTQPVDRVVDVTEAVMAEVLQ